MNESSSTVNRSAVHRGPRLGIVALVSLGLLVAGLVTSAVLGGVVPSPWSDPAGITAYFESEADAALAAGVLAFGSAIPLAVYAASVSAQMRQVGVVAAGPTIALAGGLLAAGWLGLSGLLLRTLASFPIDTTGTAAGTGAEPMVLVLHGLAFFSGGVAHVTFLGLLVAGIAVPALILRLLPRPVAITGLVIAALAELSFLSLPWPQLSVLLPVARFPGLVWLVVAGFLLPKKGRTR